VRPDHGGDDHHDGGDDIDFHFDVADHLDHLVEYIHAPGVDNDYLYDPIHFVLVHRRDVDQLDHDCRDHCEHPHDHDCRDFCAHDHHDDDPAAAVPGDGRGEAVRAATDPLI
jgi:hypothetical protein